MPNTNVLKAPSQIREWTALLKIEHFLACQKLRPTHLPAQAKASGYTPLSKTFRPHYLDQCRQMMTLQKEAMEDFTVIVVAEKSGFSLWKRRKPSPAGDPVRVLTGSRT